MYGIKVQVTSRSAATDELSEEASRLANEMMNESAKEAAESELPDDQNIEELHFSAGNPRVEHITGIVHFYRRVDSQAGASASAGGLPEHRAERLCVLGIPGDMGVADFCKFVGGYLPRVREMRVVRREEGRALCLVLLRFESQASADEFYTHYHRRPFSSLEPDVLCRLVYVREVEFTGGEQAESPKLPPGQTELPTCPVCLERLDEHISGVVTTVCNHRFHNECLRRWGDTSCPVCRYCAAPGSAPSHCTVCGTGADLWICLICGHIGCGRYRAKHAVDHWQETGHCYALETESQRVWDYASDGYVHRLIQSKTDGKLVEVPSPAPASSSRATGSGEACARGGDSEASAATCWRESGSPRARLDAEMEEALMASKMEAVVAEYSHLLVSQLESQRLYFEAKLGQEQLRGVEARAAAAQASAAAEKSEREAAAARTEARNMAGQRKALLKELAEAKARLGQAQAELDESSAMNASLRKNQDDLKGKLEGAAARIQDLEEQVRDLMVFIEAGRAIEGAGDLQGATVLPMPQPPAAAAPPKRRNQRRR